MVYEALKFLHILSIVFMSAPLFNLIVVNERVGFCKAPFAVDRYFENIIKGAAVWYLLPFFHGESAAHQQLRLDLAKLTKKDLSWDQTKILVISAYHKHNGRKDL